MTRVWDRQIRNRDSLVRRIDRCYLVAAGRVADQRQMYLERARHYREMLVRFVELHAELPA